MSHTQIDGDWSSGVYEERQLLDIVDVEWRQSTLEEEDLYIPEHLEPAIEEIDEPATVITDSQGESWPLTLAKQPLIRLPKPATTLGELSALHQPQQWHIPAGGVAAVLPGVESADGTRWLDMALQPFRAEAQRQPDEN